MNLHKTFQGPFGCEPLSIVEILKFVRSGIDVPMDVMWVKQLFTIEKSAPFQLARRSKTEWGHQLARRQGGKKAGWDGAQL